MYSTRRRRYNNYRYRIQKYYAPTINKSPIPNYYQKKGRILQVSPLRLNNENPNLITQKLLDKYYQTLVTYKYPFPNTPVPTPILPEGFENFVYNLRITNINYADLPESITVDYLYENFVKNVLDNLPSAPEGYTYGFQLNSIQIYRQQTSYAVDTTRFSFTWNTPFINTPVALCVKSVDTTTTEAFTGEMLCLPYDVNTCRTTQIAYTQTTINYKLVPKNITDDKVTDDIFYPLVTTNNESETYNSRVDILKDGQSAITSFTYFISIYFISNEF